jgi:hypothetical protein
LTNNRPCIKEGRTLLLVLNSKSWYIAPYLALEYDEVTLVHPDVFPGSLQALVEANDYSCVIYLE